MPLEFHTTYRKPSRTLPTVPHESQLFSSSREEQITEVELGNEEKRRNNNGQLELIELALSARIWLKQHD